MWEKPEGSRPVTTIAVDPIPAGCDEMNEMMSKFWVFDFYETFIGYRGVLKLNCYIGKKVQKNFLMGLKIW